MMFVGTGIGPFCGHAVHFKHFAPQPIPYSLNRYLFEAERHFKVLDERLINRRYILGATYTIVDIAAWVWGRAIPFVLGDNAFAKLPNVKRWAEEIEARPAVARVIALNQKHKFKSDFDAEGKTFVFPQNARLSADFNA